MSITSFDSYAGPQTGEAVLAWRGIEEATLPMEIHPNANTTHTSPDNGEAGATPLPESEEMHNLSLEELKGSLSELGHNPYGEVVYTRCYLASRHLSALPGLQLYIHLQRLHVDDNGLTELDAVRYMPQLVHLDARRNRLTSDVFVSLAVAAAGCLEKLYLDDNCITSLQGLEKLPFLLEFTCRRNRVQHLPASCLSAAHRLIRFSLSENALETIDIDAFAAAGLLRVLELDKNCLSSTDFLHSVLPQIETVNLAHNRVRHLSITLERLTSLTLLDVGENALSGLDELRALRRLEALRTLIFSGNSALEYLPERKSSGNDRLDSTLTTTEAQRTEYHAEVVMSDEEDDRVSVRSRDCCGGLGLARTASTTTTTLDEAAATGISLVDDDSSTHKTCSTLCPSVPATGEGSMHSDDRAGLGSALTKRTQESFSSGPLAKHTATATTAAYASLAAPEVHGFVRAVGSVRRSPKLDVRVCHEDEILALPASEQVYLWTLSVLPQLTELNGRIIRPAEVAKAAFLFYANAAEREHENCSSAA